MAFGMPLAFSSRPRSRDGESVSGTARARRRRPGEPAKTTTSIYYWQLPHLAQSKSRLPTGGYLRH